MQPPSSFLPPPITVTTPPPARKTSVGIVIVAILGALCVLGVFAGIGVATYRPAAITQGGPGAVVRVVVTRGSGTGFFVKGPDDAAYVATAFHVVSSGEPIRVERTIEVEGRQPFVEAFPEAEIVAFDAEADLAIIRLENVTADRFPRFALAKEPKKDEDVLSYGFPDSTLAKRFGMVSKPGKVLSVVKFPAYDPHTKTVLKNDAIDGVLVSTEIEPGFSGGPTCNGRGEVVGVNVTKDLVHRAQNGAVSVTALVKLLADVKPRASQHTPTPDEVKKMLVNVENQLLLLPLDKRMTTPSEDFVATSDLPRVDSLATEIRKLEGDATLDPKTKMSGRAMLGLVLLRLPGHPLETYLAPKTRGMLDACEERERGLREFFGRLVPARELGPEDGTQSRCHVLAARPLAWDLAAMAMQWEGKERMISVTRVEPVDPTRHVYRASVKFAGIDHVSDIWLSSEGGRLRLKLFDGEGKPLGLDASRNVPASSFAGAWHRSEGRMPIDLSKEMGKEVDADADAEETVSIAPGTDNKVTITHTYHRHVYLKGFRLSCGGTNYTTLDLGMEQTFVGEMSEGSITAMSPKPPRPIGADMTRCASLMHYRADKMVAFKRVDQNLVMVRTSGADFPESAELTR